MSFIDNVLNEMSQQTKCILKNYMISLQNFNETYSPKHG